jgi:hypothetical protein
VWPSLVQSGFPKIQRLEWFSQKRKEDDMTTKTNRPVETLRAGNIKAVIWRNEGDKGPFYSVYFFRTYKDSDGLFHDTDSFANGDLLKLSRLAGHAYDAVAKLRVDDNKEAGQ